MVVGKGVSDSAYKVSAYGCTWATEQAGDGDVSLDPNLESITIKLCGFRQVTLFVSVSSYCKE